MAATELLDYNQVQEQSPATGDSIPTTGGPIIWQFRADPNLAWDPSQSFFAMDVTIENYGKDLVTAGTSLNAAAASAYLPSGSDLRPFFPLRCFNSASHVIDGVTVATTSHPYVDKILQEKFLHETTVSNYGNFEGLQLARAIDDGIKEHNLARFGISSSQDLIEQGWSVHSIEQHSNFRMGQRPGDATVRYRSGASATATQDFAQAQPTHTVYFQPPFDFWTKHQRVSGGNHQVTLNLKPQDSAQLWGKEAATSCVGLDFAVAARADRVPGFPGADTSANKEIGKALFHRTENGLKMQIHRIRLLRRMVRFTIERPIATQEYNLTEMQLYVGQAAGGNGAQMTQNFLLPSSTFGLVFWWRKSSSSEYDVFNDYPTTSATVLQDYETDLLPASISQEKFVLKQFYFTYGGETYPSQRINRLAETASSTQPVGYTKLQTLSNQLMGVYNMPMEYLNTSYGGKGLMERLDSQMFFFPVAKHSNSDNSDLQVFWEADVRNEDDDGDVNATLCVAALYDARIELSYNSANQLEKVTKTEWK